MIEVAFVVVFLLIFVATAAVALLGISGVISIPEKYLGKLVYALLIEVAVVVIATFTSFNLNEAPSKLDDVLSPPTSTWIPVSRATGLPLDVEVIVVDTTLSAPTSHSFNMNLSLIPDVSRAGRYEVVHEQQPEYRLGLIDTEDLKDVNILGRLKGRLEGLAIRRVHVDSTFAGANQPFAINLYKDGEALRFSVRVTQSDSVMIDRAANKELYRVFSIDGHDYFVAVVLSVPNGTFDADGIQIEMPFAEFAIARLSKGWVEPVVR